MADDRSTYVIIGNGVAGTTAAQTLRTTEPSSKVHLFALEPYPLYNRVALPRLLKDQVAEQRVLIRDENWHEQLEIVLHLGTPVVHVNTEEQTVLTGDGQEHPYDRLLVASGGTSRPLPVPGGQADHVVYFQTLDDTLEIRERLEAAASSVSIGGSFIAYELAEAFSHHGLDTAWVMRGPHFLRRILDEEGGRLVDKIARSHGVEMVYEQNIEAVEDDGAVRIEDGRRFAADLVGCGIGLNMYVDFLQESGVRVERGIICDQYMQTSVPTVYTAGDIAEFYDVVIDRHNMMGTWNNAQVQGRVAAFNMMGSHQPYEAVPSYSSTLFDTTLTVMGLTPEHHSELGSVQRVDFAARTYRKLFFLEDRVVGAALIGDLSGRRELIRHISSGEPVQDREALLVTER